MMLKMNRKTRFALSALLLLAALAAAAAWYLTRRGADSAPDPAVEALFALRLPDTEGREQALAQWRGKVLVVNFWATWCPPCRKEIPDFSALSQDLAGAGVQFIGISIDDDDAVREFDERFKVPYPLLIAAPDVLALSTRFGNASQGLPFTVLIDRQGRVRHTRLGLMARDALEQQIRALPTP
jgi:peroxiredoxin